MNIEVQYVLTRHFTKGAYIHTDTHLFFFSLQCCLFFTVSRSILFYDAFIYFCYQELSRKRVKAQVLLLHKIHVWHIDGGHITQDVQYKPLRETPHSDASKHPKHQQEPFQPIPQLLPPAAILYISHTCPWIWSGALK